MEEESTSLAVVWEELPSAFRLPRSTWMEGNSLVKNFQIFNIFSLNMLIWHLTWFPQGIHRVTKTDSQKSSWIIGCKWLKQDHLCRDGKESSDWIMFRSCGLLSADAWRIRVLEVVRNREVRSWLKGSSDSRGNKLNNEIDNIKTIVEGMNDFVSYFILKCKIKLMRNNLVTKPRTGCHGACRIVFLIFLFRITIVLRNLQSSKESKCQLECSCFFSKPASSTIPLTTLLLSLCLLNAWWEIWKNG